MAITYTPYQGTLGDSTGISVHKYMMFGDRVHAIHKVVVHRFRMGDVEDPDLYAAQPLWEWQESEVGKWIMEHSIETPVWHRHVDPMNFGFAYAVTADLKDVDYTFWALKWGLDK
jgi:hypothetical protein